MSQQQANVFFTLLVITTAKLRPQRIADSLQLTTDANTEALIPHSYEVAYRFYYNPFFRKYLKVDYLGCTREDTLLGQTRIDFVHVHNELLKLNALHLHFYVRGLTVDLTQPNDPHCIKLAGFLGSVYDFADPEKWPVDRKDPPVASLHGLKLAVVRTLRRELTFPLSRYIYVAVCDLPQAEIDLKSDAKTRNIWRLLYFHPRGVPLDTAKSKLEANRWSGAEFFCNYYQPGGMVSVAAPFPADIHASHKSWFLQAPSQDGETTNDWQLPGGSGPSLEEYGSYDLIPEYPPLGSLALFTLEFAGFVEEIERELFSRLIKLRLSRLKLLKAIGQLSSVEDLYYKSRGLEWLRLPVTREFATDLISNKAQQALSENIRDLRTSVLNVMVMTLTLIALFITFIQLVDLNEVIAWLGHAGSVLQNWLQGILAQTLG